MRWDRPYRVSMKHNNGGIVNLALVCALCVCIPFGRVSVCACMRIGSNATRSIFRAKFLKIENWFMRLTEFALLRKFGRPRKRRKKYKCMNPCRVRSRSIRIECNMSLFKMIKYEIEWNENLVTFFSLSISLRLFMLVFRLLLLACVECGYFRLQLHARPSYCLFKR